MIKKWLQKRLINWIVHDLFNTIDEGDILANKNGVISYQGKSLGADERAILRGEAQTLSKSLLWEILSKEVKYLSNLRMFEKGKTDEDLLYRFHSVQVRVRERISGDRRPSRKTWPCRGVRSRARKTG